MGGRHHRHGVSQRRWQGRRLGHRRRHRQTRQTRNRPPQRQEGNARRHWTRQDDGLHPRSPGSFAQLIRRWNQRCLYSRDKHPKFNQKHHKKSRRKKKTTYPQINISNLPTFPRTKKTIEETLNNNIKRTTTNKPNVFLGWLRHLLYSCSFFLKFHSKTTTTKNRDLESFLSQLFSQFSSMKLKQV